MKPGRRASYAGLELSSSHVAISALVVTAVLAATVGFAGGLFLSAERVSSHRIKPAAKLQIVVRDQNPTTSQYTVLSSHVWPKTGWAQNCSDDTGRPASKGLGLLCKLPSVWKDCSGGIYLDVGTNVGVQLRKLYDPWQFPGALVLDLFTATYGHDRSKVCALGVEANPTHSAYLTVLNAFFKRKGYQALVLTETAASTRPGQATFEQDPGNEAFQEWGARLASAAKPSRAAAAAAASAHSSSSSSISVTVPLFDLPGFLSDVVRPIVQQHKWSGGARPPVGMKLDVEGEEYALLPGLITSGGLCELQMVYVELHKKSYRTEAGKAVGMLLPAIEKTFAKMRVANPRCAVNYTHVDDETYLHADVTVPLPP